MDKKKSISVGKKILFSTLSLFLFLLFLELVLRILVQPSDRCFGTLLGTELPPIRFTSYPPEAAGPPPGPGNGRENETTPSPSQSPGQEKNAGEPAITDYDIRGIVRMDPVLGYAPRESAVSPKGWWKTNKLGARSSTEIAKQKIPGKTRILFFGESFTHCSRVRQDETWPHFINKDRASVEAINFGVDGYSMAQCFLRYRGLRERLEHDGVVLVLAPSCDLERDINICRDLLGWGTHTFVPRFRIAGNELELLNSPQTGVRFASGSLGTAPLDFLRNYDSFYFRMKYESPPLIGGFVLYKFFARSCYADREYKLTTGLMEPRSEAMMVTRKIAREMEKEAKAGGKKFMLFLLPVSDDVKKYRDDPSYMKKWDTMAASFQVDGCTCADLMQEFTEAPAERMDTGCDGTHYGPKANGFIAELVARHLKERGLIPAR